MLERLTISFASMSRPLFLCTSFTALSCECAIFHHINYFNIQHLHVNLEMIAFLTRARSQ
jgi:hypothetical protein